jgi:NAD(P)-dependent dehydrogenase (short-subunit alcohol dehydrogenase family)
MSKQTAVAKQAAVVRQTAVVIGVGPERGLGATLCRQFADRDLHVIVAGRTALTVR